MVIDVIAFWLLQAWRKKEELFDCTCIPSFRNYARYNVDHVDSTSQTFSSGSTIFFDIYLPRAKENNHRCQLFVYLCKHKESEYYVKNGLCTRGEIILEKHAQHTKEKYNMDLKVVLEVVSTKALLNGAQVSAHETPDL